MEDGTIERTAQFGGCQVQAADNFWYVAARGGVIARIFTFRREGDKESLFVVVFATRGLQTQRIFLQDWDQQFFGSARICGAFQDHNLSRTKMWRNGCRRRFNEAEVGLMMIVERCGHGNDDGVHLRNARIVRGWYETCSLCRLDFSSRNAHDVRAARGQGVDLLLVDVKAGDLKLLFAEQKNQRQADVTQPNNSQPGRAISQFSIECVKLCCKN